LYSHNQDEIKYHPLNYKSISDFKEKNNKPIKEDEKTIQSEKNHGSNYRRVSLEVTPSKNMENSS
jgi:hypothetical protein